ncbi:unnamed protein product [Paramecium octaurelia]|uniref:Uncharacterized protein n=1 Tax=Paramecium octaurelia TaxID=43137 RepID=A0A8S1W0K8_PAROT|nr:unnamed protein product [Paramecium octaurelia]
MKQVSSTNDYSILRKIQIHHSHTQPKESDITLGRTTSYESSQFCKSFNIMAFRRASTKEDINSTIQRKNQACTQEKLAISNLNFIKQSQFHLYFSPSSQIEMNPLQTKVWKSLQKQMLVFYLILQSKECIQQTQLYYCKIKMNKNLNLTQVNFDVFQWLKSYRTLFHKRIGIELIKLIKKGIFYFLIYLSQLAK